jgi:hypothetical protein
MNFVLFIGQFNTYVLRLGFVLSLPLEGLNDAVATRSQVWYLAFSSSFVHDNSFHLALVQFYG